MISIFSGFICDFIIYTFILYRSLKQCALFWSKGFAIRCLRCNGNLLRASVIRPICYFYFSFIHFFNISQYNYERSCRWQFTRMIEKAITKKRKKWQYKTIKNIRPIDINHIRLRRTTGSSKIYFFCLFGGLKISRRYLPEDEISHVVHIPRRWLSSEKLARTTFSRFNPNPL